MLVASFWFLHNEHQHGWKQQQQIHVDRCGDQIIPWSHPWEKNEKMSLTLTLIEIFEGVRC